MVPSAEVWELQMTVVARWSVGIRRAAIALGFT
jgi:hypothetical protein